MRLDATQIRVLIACVFVGSYNKVINLSYLQGDSSDYKSSSPNSIKSIGISSENHILIKLDWM
jgi:hypothetical protein